MYDDGKWNKPKVVMYCQVEKSEDMLDFSINQAISDVGFPKEDFDNRCKKGGVETGKALDSISYHCGSLETRRNKTIVTGQSQHKFKRKIGKILQGIKN